MALKNERASPREIGLAVALGAFVGCTPLLGVRHWIALLLATVLRLNRLYAYAGSLVSTPFVSPFVTYAEIHIAHRIRCGEPSTLSMATLRSWSSMPTRDALGQLGEYLLDWTVGSLTLGSAIAIGLGAAAYGATLLRSRSKALS